jgi:hypothetical protein
MKSFLSTPVFLLLTVNTVVEGYNAQLKPSAISRRDAFATAALTVGSLLSIAPRQVLAEEEDVLTPLYFGVGVSFSFGLGYLAEDDEVFCEVL